MNDPFKHLTGADKLRELEDNSDEVVYKEYEKHLTQDDREEITESLVESIQKVETLSEELKQINKEKKAVISEHKLKTKDEARMLRQGYKFESGKVFIVRDQQAGMAYEYNDKGELIVERKLKPKERQTTIKKLNSLNGTNGNDYYRFFTII